MKIILFNILLMMSAYSFATDVKLASLDRYGSSPGMELFLLPNGGSSVAEVFSVIEFREREFTIRLIGESSEFTNQELMTYYRKNLPVELEAALKSSGNMHNPAINGIRGKFSEALKSTTLYKQLFSELNKLGYKVASIELEKFTVSKEFGIPLPDVYIKVVRNA